LAVTLAILLAAGVSIYAWFRQMASHVTHDAPTETVGKSAHPDAATNQSSVEKKQSSKPAANDATVRADKSGSRPRTNDAVSTGASLVVYPDEDPRAPHFTVGSSKSDVIRIQGPPNKVAGNVFVYGLSAVYFKNGRVESWHTDPGSPLKASTPE
jgi:hypothetical protein